MNSMIKYLLSRNNYSYILGMKDIHVENVTIIQYTSSMLQNVSSKSQIVYNSANSSFHGTRISIYSGIIQQ